MRSENFQWWFYDGLEIPHDVLCQFGNSTCSLYKSRKYDNTRQKWFWDDSKMIPNQKLNRQLVQTKGVTSVRTAITTELKTIKTIPFDDAMILILRSVFDDIRKQARNEAFVRFPAWRSSLILPLLTASARILASNIWGCQKPDFRKLTGSALTESRPATSSTRVTKRPSSSRRNPQHSYLVPRC